MTNSPKITFLLDENLDIHLADFLHEKTYEVITCPKGIQDSEVVNLAERNSAVLLTHDKDFANSDFYQPKDNWGIVVLRIHPVTFTNISTALNKLFTTVNPNDLFGKITVVTSLGAEIIG